MFESTKSAIDGLKSVLSLQTLKVQNALQGEIAKIEIAFSDERDRVYTLQQERTSLADENKSLKGEVAALKDWSAEEKNYELQETAFGSLVYALKAGVQSVGPPHYLCEPCFESGKKGRLHPTGKTLPCARTDSHHHEYSCSLCDRKYGFDRCPPKPLPRVNRADYF